LAIWLKTQKKKCFGRRLEMKRWLIIMAVMALAMLLTPAEAVLAQEVDPLTVMESYDLALNAGDVEGALALFADDAVLTIRGDQLVGKDEIRTWLERIVAQNSRIEPVNRQVAGDTVTWQTNFFRKDIASLSDEPLAANAEAVVQEGKIKSFSSILTDEAQARLEAAQPAQDSAAAPTQEVAAPAQDAATQEAATPVQLPSTGGTTASGLSESVILAVAGGLLLAAGLGLKRLRGTA
jgi:uncharacterized protein (TIGR02246 family)